jgi:hypothetical protein
MTRGAVIFAHNNRDIDYAYMSLISAGLAKKHLQIPVSLITDPSTLSWTKQSGTFEKLESTFDKIIEVDRPVTDNRRNLHDGIYSKSIPFVNSNRSNAYKLSPYDQTLLLDSDFLIFSDRLNSYWDLDSEVMIGKSMLDIYDQKRLGYHDKYVSDTGVHLYWATTVMFKKSEYAERFFELVDVIRENYQHYADLFRFNSQQYRNDISFSVAKHILDGFETDTTMSLPPVLTVLDKDILQDVSDNGKLTFLVTPMSDKNYCAAAVKNLDIHIMNKQSIIRHSEKLMGLI